MLKQKFHSGDPPAEDNWVTTREPNATLNVRSGSCWIIHPTPSKGKPPPSHESALKCEPPRSLGWSNCQSFDTCRADSPTSSWTQQQSVAKRACFYCASRQPHMHCARRVGVTGGGRHAETACDANNHLPKSSLSQTLLTALPLACAPLKLRPTQAPIKKVNKSACPPSPPSLCLSAQQF